MSQIPGGFVFKTLVTFSVVVFFLYSVPASLDLTPVNVTVNESSSASFQCNASGDPKPVVTWFKGGSQLFEGGRVVIGVGSMTILNTVASDTGQYSCNVSNGLRFHVGVAHLFVQGKTTVLHLLFICCLLIYFITHKLYIEKE